MALRSHLSVGPLNSPQGKISFYLTISFCPFVLLAREAKGNRQPIQHLALPLIPNTHL